MVGVLNLEVVANGLEVEPLAQLVDAVARRILGLEVECRGDQRCVVVLRPADADQVVRLLTPGHGSNTAAYASSSSSALATSAYASSSASDSASSSHPRTASVSEDAGDPAVVMGEPRGRPVVVECGRLVRMFFVVLAFDVGHDVALDLGQTLVEGVVVELPGGDQEVVRGHERVDVDDRPADLLLHLGRRCAGQRRRHRHEGPRRVVANAPSVEAEKPVASGFVVEFTRRLQARYLAGLGQVAGEDGTVLLLDRRRQLTERVVDRVRVAAVERVGPIAAAGNEGADGQETGGEQRGCGAVHGERPCPPDSTLKHMPLDPGIAALLEMIANSGYPPMYEGTPEAARRALPGDDVRLGDARDPRPGRQGRGAHGRRSAGAAVPAGGQRAVADARLLPRRWVG